MTRGTSGPHGPSAILLSTLVKSLAVVRSKSAASLELYSALTVSLLVLLPLRFIQPWTRKQILAKMATLGLPKTGLRFIKLT